MARKDTITSDFHESKSDSHPSDSIGNHGAIDPGKGVGSAEDVPNGRTEPVDIRIHKKDDKGVGKKK